MYRLPLFLSTFLQLLLSTQAELLVYLRPQTQHQMMMDDSTNFCSLISGVEVVTCKAYPCYPHSRLRTLLTYLPLTAELTGRTAFWRPSRILLLIFAIITCLLVAIELVFSLHESPESGLHLLNLIKFNFKGLLLVSMKRSDTCALFTLELCVDLCLNQLDATQ